MKNASKRALAVMALLGTAGCGQVVTRTGLAGPTLAGGVPLAIAAVPAVDGEAGTNAKGISEAGITARDAVMRALELRGHAISAEAPTRVEVALAGRSAAAALEDGAGGVLSPARRHHFLQGCRRRIDRLTLAVYADGRPGVTRVWAEEHHCHAAQAESLPALVEHAVAALHDPAATGQMVRSGRD